MHKLQEIEGQMWGTLGTIEKNVNYCHFHASLQRHFSAALLRPTTCVVILIAFNSWCGTRIECRVASWFIQEYKLVSNFFIRIRNQIIKKRCRHANVYLPVLNPVTRKSLWEEKTKLTLIQTNSLPLELRNSSGELARLVKKYRRKRWKWGRENGSQCYE